MTVELKKSKITLSILRQTKKCTLDNFKNDCVLGWCIVKGVDYMVLYSNDKKTLSMYQVFKDIKISEEKNTDFNYIMKVDLQRNYLPNNYLFKTKEEASNAEILLKSARRKALEEGQFYI